jgi:hypothetical protein
MHARAPKQTCLSNRTAAPSGDASKAADGTAAAAAAGHGHGTRSASKGGSRHSSQPHPSSRQRSSSMAMHPGGNAAQRFVQRQQQQQMMQHGGAMGGAGHGLYELHFYEDQGSPPGMHTHILEDEEEEEEQQVLLRDVSAAWQLHIKLTVFRQQQQQRRVLLRNGSAATLLAGCFGVVLGQYTHYYLKQCPLSLSLAAWQMRLASGRLMISTQVYLAKVPACCRVVLFSPSE